MAADTNTPSEPFLTDGISLGVPNDSATDITQVDNALFVDSDGNLNFKDYYTQTLTDVNGNPLTTIKLKDLITRVQGVYAQDGKLYFKDSSVYRPYSLKELVNSYVDWKSRLTTGGLYWVGSTRITNNDCNNIIVNVNGDPNLAPNTPVVEGIGRVFVKTPPTNDYPDDAVGTKVFSIDEYLDGLTDYDPILNPKGYAYTNEGALRWHNIPNLNITLPPLDENKALVVIAKANIRLIESANPVIFRLIDVTTGTELDRKAVMNSAQLPMEQQPMLTFFGPFPSITNSPNALSCVCASSPSQSNDAAALQNNPVRVLAIQFHTDDIFGTSDPVVYSSCENVSGVHFAGLERRLLGLPNAVSSTPIVNMSIDVIIFDTNPADSIGRKAGNVTMTNQDTQTIVFERPFTGSDYTVSLSCGKNINTWYMNKKSTGFTIRSEVKMTGTIDWIATKLKFEGDA